MLRIELKTRTREELVDVTSQVSDAVSGSGVSDGLAHVFCTHTTAGVTVNENADPDVCSDLLAGLERMAPLRAAWRHREGNSDAHLKASLVGSSVSVPIRDGRLVLGTWQGIYLCEFDGPRTRAVVVTVLRA
jgi:secondary thiamine-phosphate synthase enzyme